MWMNLFEPNNTQTLQFNISDLRKSIIKGICACAEALLQIKLTFKRKIVNPLQICDIHQIALKVILS